MTDSKECPAPSDSATFRLILDPPISADEAERQRRRGIAVVPRARLVDARTGKLQISATLTYIEAAIAERGLIVVAREGDQANAA